MSIPHQSIRSAVFIVCDPKGLKGAIPVAVSRLRARLIDKADEQGLLITGYDEPAVERMPNVRRGYTVFLVARVEPGEVRA